MKKEIKDLVFLFLYVSIPGIICLLSDKTLMPWCFYVMAAFVFWSIYLIISATKKWLKKRKFNKLTPEQKSVLFGDIVNQSRWNAETKKELRNFFNKEARG